MAPTTSRRFQARYAEFDAIRDYLAAASEGVVPAVRQRLVLMVEELFCNSIEHGYGGESDQPVWVELACGPDSCRITYEDCAPAHDPFSPKAAPMLEAEPESRPVGGLGVFLLMALATAHRYERRGGRNVVEVVVPCAGECKEG